MHVRRHAVNELATTDKGLHEVCPTIDRRVGRAIFPFVIFSKYGLVGTKKFGDATPTACTSPSIAHFQMASHDSFSLSYGA